VELFVESLTRYLAETIALSPFMYMSLGTNLRQGIDGNIEIMLLILFKTWLALKDYWYWPKVYLNHVFFVICTAPTEEISVMALELQSKFAENYRELWLEST